MEPRFRIPLLGRETLVEHLNMPRHRHLQAYASVVLAGAFEEIGFAGRVRAVAGDVLVHAAMDAHSDTRLSRSITLLRLPWANTSEVEGAFRVADADALARACERGLGEATVLLETMLVGAPRSPSVISDWPDLLADELAGGGDIALLHWARRQRLAAETVSRGFKSAYGVAPSSYRLELKARRAWRMIVRGAAPLAAVAMDAGFADQAHMSRALRRVTGCTPLQWRGWVAARLPEIARRGTLRRAAS